MDPVYTYTSIKLRRRNKPAQFPFKAAQDKLSPFYMLKPAPNTFNLLALGHRGAGKTVFLAGSYAESRPSPDLTEAWRLWFDCQNIKAQQNLEELLRVVACTGHYPPPTLKVTTFTFRLQRRSLLGTQTLCRFRWSDIPGEICSLRNPQFQSLLLQSQAGCLFVDAKTLAKHGPLYLETLESLIRQIERISQHVYCQNLKYPFALILTKCDRVTAQPDGFRHLQHNLMPLIDRLNQSQVFYRTFYSAIPITASAGVAALQTRRAALPFFWLTTELRKQYRTRKPQALAQQLQDLLDPMPPRTAPLRPQRQRPSGLGRVWPSAIIGGLMLLGLGVGWQWFTESQKARDRQPQTLSSGRQIVKLLNTAITSSADF